MATKTKFSIEDRLLRAQVAIDNALNDPEILAALTFYGYDEAQLQQGKTLYENTVALHQQQKREYGEQFEATEQLNNLLDEADVKYRDAVKVARIALREMHGKWQSLAITGRRKVSLSGWMEQAQQFYANALSDPDVMTALTRCV